MRCSPGTRTRVRSTASTLGAEDQRPGVAGPLYGFTVRPSSCASPIFHARRGLSVLPVTARIDRAYVARAMPSCAKLGCSRSGRWTPRFVVPDGKNALSLTLPFTVCDAHKDTRVVHRLAAAMAPARRCARPATRTLSPRLVAACRRICPARLIRAAARRVCIPRPPLSSCAAPRWCSDGRPAECWWALGEARACAPDRRPAGGRHRPSPGPPLCRDVCIAVVTGLS